jgi:Flp pilus assembly protein TadG
MLRKMRERLGERGSAAIELSLAMPIFFAVSAGVIEFGQAFNLRQNLVSAAAEAARAGSQLTCPRPTAAEARAAAAAVLSAAGLDPAAARIVLGNTGGEPGTDMTVSISYDAEIPMLSNVLPSLGANGRMAVSVEVAAENE